MKLKVSSELNLYVSAILIFINTYLEVALPVGSNYIPSFYLILTVFISFFLVKKDISSSDIKFVITILLFSLVSAFAAPNYDDINSRFVGVAQFTVAICVFVVTFKVFDRINLYLKANIFLWAARMLVILTFLEYIDVIRSISDQFRTLVYEGGNYGIYDADIRDLSLGNFIRPKVFTTEPSLVAIGFFICSVSTLSLARSNNVIFEILLLSVLEFLFLNSPILMLVFMFIAGLIWVKSKKIFILIFIVILTISPLIFFNDSVTERLSRFDLSSLFSVTATESLENETSEKLRLVYPYVAIVDTLMVNPISGLGISGKRSLEKYSSISTIYQISFGNNAFATVFIFFGLVGGGGFWFIFIKYLRFLNVTSSLFYFTLFLFMQTMGSFESARFWAYLAIMSNAFINKQRFETLK